MSCSTYYPSNRLLFTIIGLAFAGLVAIGLFGCALPASSKIDPSTADNHRTVVQSGPNGEYHEHFTVRVGIADQNLPSTQPATISKK